MKYKDTLASSFQRLLPVIVIYGGLGAALLYLIYPHIYLLKNEVIVTLTIFALWRYGWMLTHYTRALLYHFSTYPKIKRQIASIPKSERFPKHLYFLIPSYKEDAWVTKETFRSILTEVQSIPSDVTIVVATASKEEDALIAKMFQTYKGEKKIDLVFQHQGAGKRVAMGHALRVIARKYNHLGVEDPNGVTIFMDGDSYIEEGFLHKILPVFATDKNLGALTTNEVAYIKTTSKWYKEWFNLKFGQRHILFQSHAYSKKVMTLTGRLSAYRTDIVIQEAFINIVENDTLIHPLFGKFRFLMGDDKSTWFYLLKNGYDMFYIPDAICYSLESRDGNFLDLSLSLPYRWNGNTLRNNARALALGMQKTGVFIWFVILDQRLNMWTSLVGIVSALILAIFKSFYYLLFFVVWIIFVRLFQLFVISLGGHKVSLYSIPLMLYTQWMGAIIKINAYHDLSNQSWSKNGTTQNGNAQIDMIKNPMVKTLPKMIKFTSIVGFVFLLIMTHGIFNIPGLNAFESNATKVMYGQTEQVVALKMYGVDALNNSNNAQIINQIIDEFNGKSLILKLPAGEIVLNEPIVIDKDNITLIGAGKQQTKLISTLKKPHEAVIQVKGKRGQTIGKLLENVHKNSSVIQIDASGIQESDYLLLRMPNDANFLHSLGSEIWHKKYPYLRQQIVKVVRVEDENRIYLQKPLLLDFDANRCEVIHLDMVEHVRLEGFGIKQNIPNVDIKSVSFLYENSHPEYAIDAIRFDFAADSEIMDVDILESGRHALVFENAYAVDASNLTINGSWNKGKSGNGYVRFARTYYSSFSHSDIYNIRHVVLQWSSAGNILHHLNMTVDLNFHGGFSHDNRVENLHFYIPKRHAWKALTFTPSNATWAPPDGVNKIQYKTILIEE